MGTAIKFDGATFDQELDGERLKGQLKKVYDLMKDGRRRTLRDISDTLSIPESSASARIRDLRKERFGSHDVQHENMGNGRWEYWLVIPQNNDVKEATQC